MILKMVNQLWIGLNYILQNLLDTSEKLDSPQDSNAIKAASSYISIT